MINEKKIEREKKNYLAKENRNIRFVVSNNILDIFYDITVSFKVMVLKNSDDSDSFPRELTDMKHGNQWHTGEVRKATFLLQEVMYVVSSSVCFLKTLFVSGTCCTLDFNHM